MKKATEPKNEHPVMKDIRQMKTKTLSLMRDFAGLAAIAPDLPGGNPAKGLITQASKGIGNMMGELHRGADAAPPAVKDELQRIMSIVDVDGLIQTFGNLITGVERDSAMMFLRFLHEIKKVIRILWNVLYKQNPDEKVLLLIDELAGDGLKILFPDLADDITNEENRYQREIEAVYRTEMVLK